MTKNKQKPVKRTSTKEVLVPKTLTAKLAHARSKDHPVRDNRPLSEAHRNVLRAYLDLVSKGKTPGKAWSNLVSEALAFLGGQADRHTSSLADYDQRRYGPYLGVSDEGSAAPAVRMAALATPKAHALGSKASPLTLGLGLDAERLGSIGEVPVGPEEYADIWTECAGSLPMTTNVGSRSNVRFYKRAPLVIIPDGEDIEAVKSLTKQGLEQAFEPFFKAPGGPRQVVVYVQFASSWDSLTASEVLKELVAYVKKGKIADPKKHQQLGLNVSIASGLTGQKAALAGIDLARSAKINHVSIEGVVRKEGDQLISLPGLLDYLEPDLLAEVLTRAMAAGVSVTSINAVDPETVAREIWTGLNSARAMGLDLGKYGLMPLTLEECDCVVGRIQQWFPDWCAAPVFYVDEGLLSQERVYRGRDIVEGIEVWLKMVAKHKVRIVLLDTVEKSKSWKILKTNNDPKGILLPEDVTRLKKLGDQLGIRILWAGGITLDQAYLFGQYGVFGLYVTTAASNAVPVGKKYWEDPGLPAEKEPSFAGVLQFKTVLEAGYLLQALPDAPTLHEEISAAGTDTAKLSGILSKAWQAWWKKLPAGNKAKR